MALDDFLISTGVDNLIRLIKEMGRVELSQAAKELKLPAKTVEDWSHVLEEEGIVKLEYQLTKMYLVWQAPTKEYVEKKGRNLELRATSAKADIEMLLSKVEEGGRNLAAMQGEIAQATSAPVSTEETERLKTELSALQKDYSERIRAASGRLEKLRKKALASAPRGNEGAKKEVPEADIVKEIAVLHRLEGALEAQLHDTEAFFGDYEEKMDALKKESEPGKALLALEKYKADLKDARNLKDELSEAIEAITEEHKALEEKLEGVEGTIAKIREGETPGGRTKKLAEIKKLSEEAKKQKAAVKEQLQDALFSLRRQTAKFEELLKRQAESKKESDGLKDEYVEIAEELDRANQELIAREKEITGKLSSQLSLLETGRRGGASRFSSEELQKISFLLRELRREQALLEEKVHGLAKEAEILKIEAVPGQPGQQEPEPSAASEAPTALVEKVKLSEEEADEFERKRFELRSLIQKMWEENKEGKAK